MPLDFDALDEPLQDAARQIAKSRAELKGPLPDLLFHYTSAGGLLGILESARLWATNYRFLNDSSEIAYGVDLFEALVKERLVDQKEPILVEFLGRALHTANAFDGMFDCYIACFCERDDLLNQWRAYAGSGGGFALGLNAKDIGRRWGQLERSQDFVLHRVVYDTNKQKHLLREVIDTTLAVLRPATLGLKVEEANNAIARCCQFVRSEVADYLLSFKHPAYEVEHEWRLCHVASSGEEDHVKFREGPFGLTPYVCLDVSPMAGVNNNKLPLSRITHGPTPSPENVRFALRKLLRGLNYAHVEVAGSTLPVRIGA